MNAMSGAPVIEPSEAASTPKPRGRKPSSAPAQIDSDLAFMVGLLPETPLAYRFMACALSQADAHACPHEYSTSDRGRLSDLEDALNLKALSLPPKRLHDLAAQLSIGAHQFEIIEDSSFVDVAPEYADNLKLLRSALEAVLPALIHHCFIEPAGLDCAGFMMSDRVCRTQRARANQDDHTRKFNSGELL